VGFWHTVNIARAYPLDVSDSLAAEQPITARAMSDCRIWIAIGSILRRMSWA